MFWGGNEMDPLPYQTNKKLTLGIWGNVKQ